MYLGMTKSRIPFLVHCKMTLTSGLVSKIIVSRAYLLHYLRYESPIWCVDAFGDGGVLRTICGHCDLVDLDP